MSGERVLLAHKIKLLADEPIAGPTDGDVLLSASSLTGIGNRPSLTVAAVNNSGAIGVGVVFQLTIASATTTQLAASPAYPLNPVISTGGGLLNATCKQLKGRVTFFGQVTTTAIVPSPIEMVSLVINVTDNLGLSLNRTFSVPILSPDATPYAHGFQFDLPLLLPYAETRTAVQVGVRLNNTSTISVQCVNSAVTLEIDQ